MATIFYSLAGEGRGHATRVRTMVEHLRAENNIAIFAPGDAHAMLAPLYAGSDVRVTRIPGLHFGYAENGRMSRSRTALGALAYLRNLPGLVAKLEREIEREGPDLIVTDFEPALPRAARRRGVPFVSLDHQHFLIASDLSQLPEALRRRASRLGRVVELYYRGQAATIVSSFCFTGLRPGQRSAVEVGPLLRPQVRGARADCGKHLLLYLRKFASAKLIEALAATGCEVRVYGLGVQPARGKVRFFAIDERRFVEDLATSYALISTAGNQLLGEALYLRKPVLALPEPGNGEQLVHGHLLANARVGEWLAFEHVDAARVRGFLERVDSYRAQIAPERHDGNPAALAELRRYLPPRTPAAQAARSERPNLRAVLG